ncbi:hypothetical protein RNZ50_18565 [Paracoccaceae bacterium Fryx2]|nr:hypothetical protein [Paracoccaceae bacterium Fryx2]
MRQMILVMTLTDEEQALWAGRSAMVVALNDQEAQELKESINAVDDFVTLAARAFTTLEQVLETRASAEPDIAKTLAMLREPARKAVMLSDRTRELLGRAVFIGPKTEKGKLQ